MHHLIFLKKNYLQF